MGSAFLGVVLLDLDGIAGRVDEPDLDDRSLRSAFIGDALTLELGDGLTQVADGETDMGAGRLDGTATGRRVDQVELDVAGRKPVSLDAGDVGPGFVGQAQESSIEGNRVVQAAPATLTLW